MTVVLNKNLKKSLHLNHLRSDYTNEKSTQSLNSNIDIIESSSFSLGNEIITNVSEATFNNTVLDDEYIV